MKGIMKKAVSVIVAMAMIVTGLSYTPNSAKAAEGDDSLPTSQQITKLKAPKKAYLCDFRLSGSGYNVVFEDADEDVYTVVPGDVKSFDVYVGSEKKATVSESGETVDISSWGFEDGSVYEITVKEVLTRATADGGTETLESPASGINYFTYVSAETKPIDTGVARVFVTTTRDSKTKNWNLYKSGQKQDVKASLVVQKSDGSIDVAESGTIKLRGNSTSTGQKKPFNIKFDSKKNVFGFGKAKKWSLLANTFDRSLIRNQTGVQFHHKIMEANQTWQFTSECEPIDFYLDGHYMGAYLLLESVEAGSTRVDIDAENPDNHEILLELDMTDRDVASDAHLDAHTTLMNMGFTINEPEGPGRDAADENHEDHQEWLDFNETYAAKKQYTLDYLNNMEQKIQNGGDGTLDEIGQIIDVQSFVNYYITAELFRITDVSFSSVRYFIKKAKDGSEKLYAGPLWDLDLSSGNADGAAANPDNDMHAQDNPWFGALMKNKEFRAEVTKRFNEVLPEINKLVAEGGTIDTIADTIRKSAEANYSAQAYNAYDLNEDGTGNGWAINKIYTAGEGAYATAEEARTSGSVSGSLVIHDNYQAYVDDFKSYMTGRIKYLKKQFDATDYDEVLTDIADQMGSYAYNLAKKKPSVLYKNCHQEGKQEYLNDGSLTEGQNCPLTNSDTVGSWGTENQPAYATIDLGDYYDASTIDKVVVQYKNGEENDTVLNRPYSIQYSIDGKNFREAASSERAVLDSDNRTIDEVNTVTGIVRYVRLYFPRQAGYGMQIREFAVLDTDKDAAVVEREEVADVTNLVLTSPANNQIGVQFDASTTEGATYKIYIDGKVTMEDAVAGQINLINDIKTGKHTVKVETMSPTGFVSEGVSGTVTVIGAMPIEEMAADPNYNIAYKTVPNYSSWKEGSNHNTITDGIVNDHKSYEGIHVEASSNNTGYFQINLNQPVSVKSIDEIAVWYRDGRADLCPYNIGYTIQYSEDGIKFHTVKTVTPEEMPLDGRGNDTLAYVTTADMGDIVSPVSTVKAIRVLYNGSVGWGVQAREIAVLDKTGNAGADREEIEISEPILTVSSDAYNAITATVTAGEGQEDYTYTIYLDGKAVYTDVAAGTYTIKDVTEGTHTVAARSNYENAHSNGVSQTVYVVSGFEHTQSTLAGRLLPDSNENGNNYLRYTGVSAEASSGNGALAIDNNAGTRWESDKSDPQEIVVDLGAVYTVKEIAAVWETAASKDFNVQVSTDGISFETVAMVNSPAKEIPDRYDDIVLTEAVQARIIKIKGTSRVTIHGHSIWEMAVYGSDEQKEYVPIFGPVKNVAVDSYAKWTGKYIVTFKENEAAESYNIYADDVLIKNVDGSGYYLTSEDLQDFGDGEHTISVASVREDGVEAKQVSSVFNVETAGTSNNDIPQIYISTGGKAISGEYFAKQEGGTNDVNIAVVDSTGKNKDVVDSLSDIKIRGNTTAGGEKKPYNFKLNKKKELLGMKGKAKKWSLLANAFDKSLMRNALVMQLASVVGLDYTSECRFADVYLNGTYLGNYLLIESIEAGDGRVEIDAENEEGNDALLEVDNNNRDAAETFHLKRSDMGVLFMLGEPEFGPDETDMIERYQNKINNTQTLISNFETALKADDIDEMSKYIDIDSFAKFYIVNEFFRNQDINFSSTRFYVKDNIMYAGPCWDYDLSSGNIGQYYSGEYKDGVTYNSYKAQELVWYRYLMQNETFKNKVVKYYYQYLPQIQALFDGSMADTGYGIDGLLDKYGAAFERNYASKEALGAGWNVTEPDQADAYSYATNREWKSYDDSVDFLRSWLTSRDAWLQSQFDKVLISRDIAVTGYQISTSLDGVFGKTGIRTVYQKEPLVEKQEVTEFGLVYGLDNGQITDDDMVIDSVSEYVVNIPATEDGRYDVQMGESTTADYYVMTMDTAANYTQNYKVRVYAKLSDGTTVYSGVSAYNVYSVAEQLYENNKMPNYKAHEALYTYVLSSVNPEYAAVDYNWNQTLADRTESTDDLKIEGYQMTASLQGTEGRMGLKVVYSADNDVRDNQEEIGLIYGLLYNNDLTADDMLLENADGDNIYIKSYAATSQGEMDYKMGSSPTAKYYTRTMNVTGLSAVGYTAGYMVRAYAKLSDGTIAYSDVCTYSVNDVAATLYNNNLMSTFNGHDTLYNKILKKVDKDYKQTDYNWTNTIVK